MKSRCFNYFQVRGINRPGDMASLVCKNFTAMRGARAFAKELAAKDDVKIVWINSFHHGNAPTHPSLDSILFHPPGDQNLHTLYIKSPAEMKLTIAYQNK